MGTGEYVVGIMGNLGSGILILVIAALGYGEIGGNVSGETIFVYLMVSISLISLAYLIVENAAWK